MSLVSKLIYPLYYGDLYFRSNYVYIIQVCYRHGNFFFLHVVGGNPQQCYQQLLIDIREILTKEYSQKLQVGHPCACFQ